MNEDELHCGGPAWGEQPRPEANNHPAIGELVISDLRQTFSGPVNELVIADIRTRMEHGKELYGTYLQPFNGRDSLVDAYQECIDLIKYWRVCIYEGLFGSAANTLPWRQYWELCKMANTLRGRILSRTGK